MSKEVEALDTAVLHVAQAARELNESVGARREIWDESEQKHDHVYEVREHAVDVLRDALKAWSAASEALLQKAAPSLSSYREDGTKKSDADLWETAWELSERILVASETGLWDDVPEGWAIDLATLVRRLYRDGFGQGDGGDGG